MLRQVLNGTLLLAALSAPAQQIPPPLTADAIMALVAANQDASEAARAHYLYVQHVRIASRKGKTVRCEEITDSRVTPAVTGPDHQLLKLDGRLLLKDHYVTYNKLPADNDKDDDKNSDKDRNKARDKDKKAPAPKDDDENINIGDGTMDRDLVENMRKNLTTGKSKDGISANLFPLTSKEQADYRFTLLGREPRNGRDCFHITFSPKDKDDYGWKGDAWIDATAFQPVILRTTMARKLPFAVRALLGTNVPGLGFTIVYAPQPADQPGALWFPISFGTEFKLHVLFFLNREIVFNAENRDFQQTHTSAEIHDAPAH